MKQRIITIVAIALLFAGVAHAQQAAFDTNLHYGMTGNTDVEALQEFLTSNGDYTGPITGNFFYLTAVAVKKFQLEQGLPQTGYFGVLSRAAANTIIATQLPAPSAAEVGTSTPATTTTVVPVTTPQITSQPQTTMTNQAPAQPATAVAQAPQFMQAPTPTLNVDKSEVNLAWTTDQAATATLYVDMARHDDWSQLQPLETFDANTNFTAQVDPKRGVWFYAVIITANGQSTVHTGQLPGF